MRARQEFVVYLSSTLADLEKERDVALKTIAEFGVVKTSFRASEEGVVATCTNDVRKSNLYIGILGQRYGYVPPAAEGNPAEKSITELEYETCRTPGQPRIARLMFIKPTEAGIAAAHIDALSNKTSAPRMEAFLNRAGKDQTAYVFKNLDDLRSELRIRVQEKTDQFHKENERSLGTAVPGPVRVVAGPGFDLDAYQKAMRHRYSRLKLEELDPTTHDIQPLTLTSMFIPQSVRERAEFMPRVFELPKELQQRLRQAGELEGAALDEETLAQQRRAYQDQSPRPVLEVINEPALRRLVILGDPGSGKSTLLQYLLLEWAEKAAPRPQQDPLPLLIELREYARLRHEGAAASFLEYLHHGASVRWHFDQVQLDYWMKANPSVVLFDGLDEVFDPTLRKEVITAIHRFADEYLRARVLVTSRIIGYQHQSWRDEGFRHFMLQDLDDAQIEDFLGRWHRGAYKEAHTGNVKRQLLARAIADSAAIRRLAGNPLLLTMMAILNRTHDLPRDRVRLYEKCAELLLHQWKAQEALNADPVLRAATLDFTDKRNLLLRVARAMQTSERGLAGNLIDEPTLERALTDGLKGMPNLRPDRAARALIEQLRGRNFMLCSVGGRSYGFVHRTFLEYFCALEVLERFQTDRTLSPEQLKTEIFGHWADDESGGVKIG